MIKNQLFSPITLRNLQLKNRIIIAPMCQYSAENGIAGTWHQVHIGTLSLSSAGLVIIEATAVEAIGRISSQDLGLWDDATEKALTKLVEQTKSISPTPIAIQLAHAGRKASTFAPWVREGSVPLEEGGWQTVAPSAIEFNAKYARPQALDKNGLERIKTAFVNSAKRAERAGIDAIEVHAAHGYLLHEFLSPLSNQRTDEYGGSLENRMRYVLDIFQAIRKAVPDIVLGIRISATDWVEGGWDLEQSIALAHKLKTLDCDYIHVSSGGLASNAKIKVEPGYQVPFAEKVKQETGIPTIAVGLITEAEQAEQILQKQQADMVALARGILFDPRWPWHAAAALGDEIVIARQYLRAPPANLAKSFP